MAVSPYGIPPEGSHGRCFGIFGQEAGQKLSRLQGWGAESITNWSDPAARATR